MSTSALSSRLQALTETHKPFPLKAYLHIYNCAMPDCRNDYFKGMILLVKFLGHPSIETVDRETLPTIPLILRSYNFVELAKVLYPENRFLGEDLIYKELIACQ